MTTAADVYAQVSDLVTKIDVRDDAMSAWLTQAADGGPDGDGMVLFTRLDKTTFKYPCFQKLVASIARGDDARQDCAVYFGGNFGANESLFSYTAVADAAYDVSQSFAKCKGAPASQAVISIKRGGVAWGTVTFAAGSTVGVIAISDPTQARGQEIEFVAPPVHDPAFTNVSISLAGA